MDEEVGELCGRVRVRPGALAADGGAVLVRLWCGRLWCERFRDKHVGVGIWRRVAVFSDAADVALAGGVGEEQQRGEEEEDVGGDVGGAVGVRGDEGVGEREDGEGGPEGGDEGGVHAGGAGGIYMCLFNKEAQ